MAPNTTTITTTLEDLSRHNDETEKALEDDNMDDKSATKLVAEMAFSATSTASTVKRERSNNRDHCRRASLDVSDLASARNNNNDSTATLETDNVAPLKSSSSTTIPRTSRAQRKNSLPRALKPTSTTSSSLPESIAWRVTRSWELVADKTEKVGVDFFLRLFEEHPQATDLFRFGGDILALIQRDANGRLVSTKNVPRALRVHAKKVLDTVGVCVGGMSHLPDLVPTLRSLGKFHASIGVQPFHYDAIYRHLLDAIEAEVGKDNFDQETRESWEIVYRSLTQVMKNPNSVLQMEPLEGWGTVATAACAFLTIVTPLQMARLTSGNPVLSAKLTFGTIVAAIVLALDMSSHWIADQVRPTGVAFDVSKRSPLRRKLEHVIFPFKFRAIRFLRSLQMDRWVQWTRMESIVLLSFPLQYSSYWIIPEAQQNPHAVGVHWTYSFGFLRLVAAARVFHAFACAENNFLLRKRQINKQDLSTLRMIKLIATMLLVIHINSALWCLVARIEFGPGNDAADSAFFPLADQIFTGKLSCLNSYLHAVHWAWVNLAGIGDDDSKPETTLECFTTLFVHICGATLYTITTGNVVNILESMSAKQNEVGGDLAELGHFMQTCHVPQDIQKRIMEGYMMKKMIGDATGDDVGLLEMNVAPTSPDAISRLPRHLEAEIKLYYRAEAIRRRDAGFAHCSHEFLVAFVASLKEPSLVLSEEVHVHEGQPLPEHVTLIVDGVMQVIMDGVVVRTLEAGDLIGKNHLFGEGDRMADRFGLRAETTCSLVSGLFNPSAVERLKRRYPRDFSLLMGYRVGQVVGMSDLSWISTGSASRRHHQSLAASMSNLSHLAY